jgi:hypothetical protein
MGDVIYVNVGGYATGDNPIGYDEYCPYEDYD